MLKLVRKLIHDTRGGAAIEYGLMVAFIVIAMIASFSALADVTVGLWNTIDNNVSAKP